MITSAFRKHNRLIVCTTLVLLSIIVSTFRTFKFKTDELLNFGFTPEYISIASNTIKNRNYSDNYSYYMPILTNNIYFKDLKIPVDFYITETQREPLYPTTLLLCKLIFNDYSVIIFLQKLILVFTLACWSIFLYRNFNLATSFLFLSIICFSPTIFYYFSIIYPYSFQFTFLIFAIISLGYSLKSKSRALSLIPPVLLGLSIFERGAIILLPLFIFISLMFANKYFNLKLVKKSIKYVLLAYILILPWLARNLIYGTIGINQMTGYSIGYTFGDLPPINNEGSLSKEYNAHLAKIGNMDAGTISFILLKTITTGKNYSTIDRELSKVITKRIIARPDLAIKKIFTNINNYPSRLISNFNPNIDNIWVAYIKSAQLTTPTLYDKILFILFLLNIIYLCSKRNILAIISMLFTIYIYAFSTTTVIFDPRYRSIIDLLSYSFLSIAAISCLKYFIKILSSGNRKQKNEKYHFG